MIPFSEFEAQYHGKRYEYIDGEAVPMGAEFIQADGQRDVFLTAGEGLILGELNALFGGHVQAHSLGLMYMDVGFLVQSDPPNLIGADLAFIVSSRLGQVVDDNWLTIAPDLVVRIVQRGVEPAARVPVSEDGTRLLLLVYPNSRVIDVYRPNQPIITLRPGDVLDCSDVMSGFTVPVADIFAVLD